MKKVKSIHTGLIAATFATVLLAGVSTSASSYEYNDYPMVEAIYDPSRTGHWAPYTNGWDYFWGCTIAQSCAGSRWR